jgi:hypothetical protein
MRPYSGLAGGGYRLIGRQRVITSGGVVLSGRRERLLLAKMLLSANRAMSASGLVDTLLGESSIKVKPVLNKLESAIDLWGWGIYVDPDRVICALAAVVLA